MAFNATELYRAELYRAELHGLDIDEIRIMI